MLIVKQLRILARDTDNRVLYLSVEVVHDRNKN